MLALHNAIFGSFQGTISTTRSTHQRHCLSCYYIYTRKAFIPYPQKRKSRSNTNTILLKLLRAVIQTIPTSVERLFSRSRPEDAYDLHTSSSALTTCRHRRSRDPSLTSADGGTRCRRPSSQVPPHHCRQVLLPASATHQGSSARRSSKQ